jgi:hypothetical protein
VADITFYKAASKGKLEEIEASVGSLHTRRVLVIEDRNSSVFWIIDGKSASASASKNARANVKTMIKASPDMIMKEISFDDAPDQIESILGGKKPVKIPQVPSKGSTVKKAKFRSESEGPIIKEFQIAYYKDEGSDDASSSEIYELLDAYREAVLKIFSDKPAKSTADKKLKAIGKKIIDQIYE